MVRRICEENTENYLLLLHVRVAKSANIHTDSCVGLDRVKPVILWVGDSQSMCQHAAYFTRIHKKTISERSLSQSCALHKYACNILIIALDFTEQRKYVTHHITKYEHKCPVPINKILFVFNLILSHVFEMCSIG